jgi:hypothetical protein
LALSLCSATLLAPGETPQGLRFTLHLLDTLRYDLIHRAPLGELHTVGLCAADCCPDAQIGLRFCHCGHDREATVHPVNSDVAENGKLEQVLSNRGFVCLLRISRRFLAQPSRPANRNPRPSSSTQCASALRQTATLERGRPLALSAFISELVRMASGSQTSETGTVGGWHYKGFRLFWAWKCRHGRPGRPAVSLEVRQLVRRMSRENQLWGAPKIHGELLKLGFDISETSVSKYLVCRKGSPLQSWKTFLENHVRSLVSVDFFTVPTIRFQILYVFLVMAHERRRIVHFAVTQHPTAEWTAHQLREAFPWDTAPRFLLRDRDRIFGAEFVQQLKAMDSPLFVKPK